MIKLLVKHNLLEYTINTLFDGLIKNFSPSIIKVTYDQMTDDMVGKMVVFVEASTGYDYTLPTPLERGLVNENDHWYKPWMKYVIKGKRRRRPVARHEPNMTCHYFNRRGRVYDSVDQLEFTLKGMVYHIDMNS